jgi:hypothetical protein
MDVIAASDASFDDGFVADGPAKDRQGHKEIFMSLLPCAGRRARGPVNSAIRAMPHH